MLEDFSRHFAALDAKDVPAETLHACKLMMLDTAGSMIAARSLPPAGEIDRFAARLGGTAGVAYRNARLGDLMDFTEGFAGAHFGCGPLGAALALARETPVSGMEMLLSILSGYEVAARFMEAIGPYYTDRSGDYGYAPVWSICPPVAFGSAATAARLMAFGAGRMEAALLVAGGKLPIPTGGVWVSATFSPETKYGDAGWAAVAGLAGAFAAESGFDGFPQLVEDGHLFRILSAPHPDPDALLRGLGSEWKIGLARFKPWPCCGLNFGVIDNLQKVMRRHSIAAKDISAIIAEVGAPLIQPNSVNAEPRTGADMQFSIPHCLAMMALGVPPGPAWQSGEALHGTAAAAMRAKVLMRRHEAPWPTAPSANPRHKPSAVRVLVGSREYVDETRLDGEVPAFALGMSEPELIDKFLSLVEADDARTILDLVLAIENVGDAGRLAAAIEHARPRKDAQRRAATLLNRVEKGRNP